MSEFALRKDVLGAPLMRMSWSGAI